MNIILTLFCITLFLIFLGWLGLHINPKPFPVFPQNTSALKTIPLPQGLPAPVRRFYREIYSENVPLIESAVITGRALLRLGGITFKGRFRFTHNAGKDYHHYLEATLFGLPLMKVNEHYINGKSRLELPFGVTEGEIKVDQAANLGMWSESLWLPSILITDQRVRWETVDEDTTLLVIPFGETLERFVVRFDPLTGLVRLLEGMRYKSTTDQKKVLWLTETLEWNLVNGHKLATAAIIWLDEGKPWAVFTPEEVVYNADIQEYIRAKGI
jgi:hypothetical protein